MYLYLLVLLVCRVKRVSVAPEVWINWVCVLPAGITRVRVKWVVVTPEDFVPVEDIGGSKGDARDVHPLGVQLLLFSYSFRQKKLWELALHSPS